jgi:hypothetical protein
MAERKTQKQEASVADFLNAIPDAQVREDCWAVAGIMQKAAKAEPKMWGPNIVGFGHYRQVYANGKEADWMLIAFSPRKQNLTLYVGGFEENADLMAKLGTHACGKGCLYIKRLSDVHVPTLKKLVAASVKRRSAKSA